MSRKYRLIFLLLSFLLLAVVGRWASGSFEFFLTQFWFTSGLLLLILLSLVDQPFFSKDANIFVNAITGFVSLMVVDNSSRDFAWKIFLCWMIYLIVSSYLLMWIRSNPKYAQENFVLLISRFNRQLGKPQNIFSVFFLWGCLRQFGMDSYKFDGLFLFWAIFIFLDLPGTSSALNSFFDPKDKKSLNVGQLLGITNPKIAEVLLNVDSENTIGRRLGLFNSNNEELATGIGIDDRIVLGRRIGKLAITTMENNWASIAKENPASVFVFLIGEIDKKADGEMVSVVDEGSNIEKLICNVRPEIVMETGEIVWTEMANGERAFYQVVAGQISEEKVSEENNLQSVKVSAGQIGVWDKERCRFEPVTWVAPAGELVHRASSLTGEANTIPDGQITVGKVPNSEFPVHVNISDIVTHNTAVIGVTGSGKSYLSFHLIESIMKSKVKVLILDISRQHYTFLSNLNPTQLKTPADVAGWLKSDSLVGIHQFAIDSGYPQMTAQFVEKAFKELSAVKLKAGVNEPARLCIVFEEAHSLIPEWNQVSDQRERDHVNTTARIILQGRKYGMGSLVITQRTANVTKTILNQCNTIFALQSFDQTGLDFLKNYMGEEYSRAISTLPVRTAVLVGKASSSTRPILFQIEDFTERWKSESPEALSSKSLDGEK